MDVGKLSDEVRGQRGGVGAVAALITCIPTLAIFVVGYALCAVVGVVTTAILGAVIGAIVGTV
ncbi:hypothetical protein, partial [Nocardia abscessus]|uniref:hypothetical protein n=1 Tax=Nocardia abscessus TaxID=120957 RepID=UPI0024547F18